MTKRSASKLSIRKPPKGKRVVNKVHIVCRNVDRPRLQTRPEYWPDISPILPHPPPGPGPEINYHYKSGLGGRQPQSMRILQTDRLSIVTKSPEQKTMRFTSLGPNNLLLKYFLKNHFFTIKRCGKKIVSAMSRQLFAKNKSDTAKYL